MVLVAGLRWANKDLELARGLKKGCSTGGTIKGGVTGIRGEQRDRLVALLEKKDYAVKRTWS